MMNRLAYATAAILAATAISAPAANAAQPAPKPAPAVVGSMPASAYRIDRQDPPPTVVVLGVSKGTPVTVNWGDGNSSVKRSRCTVSTAARNPSACAVTLSYEYSYAENVTVTVRVGRAILANAAIVISPEPRAWAPPEGWVQPAGWSVFNAGATYLPCSTIPWFWDRTSEPADRTLVHDDVQRALDMISEKTGLTYVETVDRAAAKLTFNWSEQVDRDRPGASGFGGGYWNSQMGTVSLSPTKWWAADAWRGFGVVTQPDGRYGSGNAWLIIHEVLHTLGMGHVNDPAQVMNPVNSRTDWGSGDVDGLYAVYRSQPCPAP
jgi:hypothetical protein